MTYGEACDAIFGAFNAVWTDETNGPLSILTYTPEIRWQYKQYAGQPSLELHYVEVAIKTTSNQRTTFRGPFQVGQKMTRRGIVYVDYFFSRTKYKTTEIRDLPEIGKKAFLSPVGEDGCILFRNPVNEELPALEQRWRSRTTARWEYETIHNPIEVEQEVTIPED